MLGQDLTVDKCSRAGCSNLATHKMNWRNPKIHSEDRIKTWLACDEHLGFLVDYLETRGFFIAAVPF